MGHSTGGSNRWHSLVIGSGWRAETALAFVKRFI